MTLNKSEGDHCKTANFRKFRKIRLQIIIIPLYVKYTNKIPAQLFHYMLFYMKPDTISMFIFGFYRPSIIGLFSFMWCFCFRNCLDFDLCESCEDKPGSHNPDHVFVKIRKPCYRVGVTADGIRKPLLKTSIYRAQRKCGTKLLIPIYGEGEEDQNDANLKLER